jgi:hypothetical protein
VPFANFSSVIVITLTYRSMVSFLDVYFKYNKKHFKNNNTKLNAKISIRKLLLNINDDHELIYSNCDINYVLDLLEGRAEIRKKKCFRKFQKYNYFSLQIEEDKSYKTMFLNFLKKTFDWHPNFRFSSRFINTMVAALCVLYYFILFVSYQFAYYSSLLISILPQVITDGKLVDSVLWTVIGPLLVTTILSLFQVYFLSRDVKKHLNQLYKGKCEFVKKAETLGRGSISSSSLHFGGYLYLKKKKNLIYINICLFKFNKINMKVYSWLLNLGLCNHLYFFISDKCGYPTHETIFNC